MLISQRSLAREDIRDLSCLSRADKEKIGICFEENESCHAELADVSKETVPSSSLAYGVILGIALGFVGASQMRH